MKRSSYHYFKTKKPLAGPNGDLNTVLISDLPSYYHIISVFYKCQGQLWIILKAVEVRGKVDVKN